MTFGAGTQSLGYKIMGEDEELRDTMQRLRKHAPDRTVRLGDTLSELMKNRISPLQSRFGPVAELWNQLLPTELTQHCSLTGISGGQLKVLVDSPVYLYELKLCGSELLEQLQQQCPRARIRKIKFIVGD